MLRLVRTAMRAAAGLARAAGAAAPQTAIFAGGCFWSMEAKFETLPGVINVVSGATGGRAPANEAEFAAGRSGFWPAPAYHQDFARRNAERYARYDRGCGRTAKLHAMWGGVKGKS